MQALTYVDLIITMSELCFYWKSWTGLACHNRIAHTLKKYGLQNTQL